MRQHADPFSNLEELMNEKKSWSKSKNWKVAQAVFICLTHNLTLLMEDKLEKEVIENTKVQETREKKLDDSIKKAKVDRSMFQAL